MTLNSCLYPLSARIADVPHITNNSNRKGCPCPQVLSRQMLNSVCLPLGILSVDLVGDYDFIHTGLLEPSHPLLGQLIGSPLHPAWLCTSELSSLLLLVAGQTLPASKQVDLQQLESFCVPHYAIPILFNSLSDQNLFLSLGFHF